MIETNNFEVTELMIWSLLGLSAVLTSVSTWRLFWSHRRKFAAVQSLVIGLLAGFSVATLPAIYALLMVFVQIYRLVAALRIAENRINSRHLKRINMRSEIALLICSALILLTAKLSLDIESRNLLMSLAVSQLCVISMFLRHVLHMKKITAVANATQNLTDQDLPTLTIAIPARNETNELTDCLKSVLDSDYPKLEVLVLDDCSQDNTSDIIRSFAHRGVRFVKGTPPPEHWIAKNHAYAQLFDNASGDYVLYIGTDVRMGKDFARHLMQYVLGKKLSMASVLPSRLDEYNDNYLLLPMRYWRELVWPKSLHRTPPALSTCWLIRRDHLKNIGKFSGLRQSIRPEWPIAKSSLPHYRFVRSNQYLNISSRKTLHAQWDTAVRTRYPELHRRPESVAFATLWQFAVLLGPILMIFVGVFYLDLWLLLVGLISSAMLVYIHLTVLRCVQVSNYLKPLILYPYSVILEIVTINYSMWEYEFGTVTWRGRNVCLPVIDIQPRLPKS